ncbi:hypothetical protein LPB19_10685 [Marinobacter salinisoli]|uniref:ATP-grasp domain-containing protein n=1 Tax=Marinobacter salinisoli TaxID=2769486 RepID=A0ABX7MN47_9GAMM|nr:hypothetical protein [Marinobacter salinisoli]QSP93670.1 hypothetical protein LPB19_10685 [Marinobacter salinisoli]
MEQAYVIILANGLNGLGAVRSAVHAGIKAYTLVANAKDLSAYSRYSRPFELIPRNPTVSEIKPILDRIRDVEGTPGVVLACSDPSAELIGQLKDMGYTAHHLIGPTSEATNILNDKRRECLVMESGGVTLPKTYYLLDEERPESYPVLIKPRSFREYEALGSKNLVLNDSREADEFREKFRDQLDKFIAQEIIPGADDNLWVCNVTFDLNQELSACFVFNRLGTMPSHYGVTSLAISRDNQILREECERIGKALGYTGPAMIEFKRDPRSGKYYYIETNPRLGMCNWFDTRCGINNVLASARVANGDPVDFQPQKNDRIYWNFFGDLIARLENREKILTIARLYLGLLRRHRVGAIFYWRDPLPALKYSWDTVQNVMIRVVRVIRKAMA